MKELQLQQTQEIRGGCCCKPVVPNPCNPCNPPSLPSKTCSLFFSKSSKDVVVISHPYSTI